MRELLTDLDRWRTQDKRIAIARVVDVDGPGPRAPGAAMAVNSDAEVTGSVSGGCVEGAVVEVALAAIESGDRHGRVLGPNRGLSRLGGCRPSADRSREMSLMKGDGSVPKKTVEVPVMDESADFSGQVGVNIDHAWSVVQGFLGGGDLSELGEWVEL